jgi:hypothetical protein
MPAVSLKEEEVVVEEEVVAEGRVDIGINGHFDCKLVHGL